MRSPNSQKEPLQLEPETVRDLEPHVTCQIIRLVEVTSSVNQLFPRID